jgi:dTDP-4-amino-4,6-dideoxygalactose transaminase
MGSEERELLLDAFDSNWIAPLGPHVNEFEKEFAEKVGMPHAVALSSCTAAIHLSLLLMGVQRGDFVLTSSLTFVATANAIRYTGAVPVFVDSDPHTWNMDPELLNEKINELKRSGTPAKAVVSVDVNGQCCDYEAIESICQEHDIPIIEDAAESLGASYQGRSAGQFGDLACFSFNGNKIITTSGGGMMVTRNKEHADRARYLSTQARMPAAHYEHVEVGFNYRMSNLLAAVGRGQLRVLENRVERRREIFHRYQSAFDDLPGIQFMPEPDDFYSTHWLTALTIDAKEFGCDRETVRLKLEESNIESRPIWKPMHMQPAFAEFPRAGGDFCEHLFKNGLCLPSGSSMTDDDQDRVVSLVRACCLETTSHSDSA